MQHDNNIENKLRQQEAIEQPDLSQMDAHWQQMAGMLQPAVLPVKKVWPKWMLNGLSAVAVVLLIGAAVLYVSSKKNNEGEKTVKQNEVAVQENPGTNTVPPTSLAVATDTTTAAFHKPTINLSLIREGLKQWTEEDSLLGTVKLQVAPCGNCDDKKDDAVFTNAERQMKLQNLFVQLEKQEQHFTIDNSGDTLLQFEEGTALLVPANSFGGMNGVELTAKEFYKTSDIVLNQLNTASNKEQLETGGMFHLQASYKGNEVKVNDTKPLVLFMPNNGRDMVNMQLFAGQQCASKTLEHINDNLNTNFVDWMAMPQQFIKRRLVTEVRVLNVADIPWLVKETENKKVGYFIYDEDSLKVSKNELKRIIKEKYGYTKVKLTSSIRNRFIITSGSLDETKFDRQYSEHLGDSMWMEKETADKYKLSYKAIRKIVVDETSENFGNPVSTSQVLKLSKGNRDTLSFESRATKSALLNRGFNKATIEIFNRYSVNLSQLGWINCDRFYTDNRKKIQFKVDLADSANNYYTMLVFDKLNSMMTGYVNGNQVAFQNIPLGEPVKVISIGINQNGETVYSVTHTTTSEEGLKGLQFQITSAPDLKASLSKIDN